MAKKSEEKQLDFGFKNPIQNILQKYKQTFLLRFAYFETKKYIRSPLSWLAITSIIALIGYQGYLLYIAIDQLPSQLPIFAHLIELKRKLAGGEFILLFPIISIAQGIISIMISYRSFYKSKEISYFILYLSLAATILLTVAELRLISGYYG